MTERPARKVFSRPPDDDAELDAWAESFANALLDRPSVGSERAALGDREADHGLLHPGGGGSPGQPLRLSLPSPDE